MYMSRSQFFVFIPFMLFIFNATQFVIEWMSKTFARTWNQPQQPKLSLGTENWCTARRRQRQQQIEANEKSFCVSIIFIWLSIWKSLSLTSFVYQLFGCGHKLAECICAMYLLYYSNVCDHCSLWQVMPYEESERERNIIIKETKQLKQVNDGIGICDNALCMEIGRFTPVQFEIDAIRLDMVVWHAMKKCI